MPLTVDQVRALAAAIGEPYRAMVLTQAGLGLRLGELLALRVEDVNFLARTVRVEDQIDKQTRERVPPKTARSRRTLPLPEVVSTALAEHIRVYPPAANGLLFHTATVCRACTAGTRAGSSGAQRRRRPCPRERRRMR